MTQKSSLLEVEIWVQIHSPAEADLSQFATVILLKYFFHIAEYFFFHIDAAEITGMIRVSVLLYNALFSWRT